MGVRKKSYSQFTILDLVCMTIGFFAGIYLRHGNWIVLQDCKTYGEVYSILVLCIIVTAFFFRPYEDIFRRGKWLECVNVSKCLLIQVFAAIFYMFLRQSSSEYSRIAFVVAFGIIYVLTYFARCALKRYLRRLAEKGKFLKKLLIVSTSGNVEALLKEYKEEIEFEYQISGLVLMDQDLVGQKIKGVPVIGNSKTIYDDARLMVVDSVLIDLEPEHPEFRDTVNLFHVMGVEINISLAEYHLGIPDQQIVKMGGLTVLSGNSPKETMGDRIAKRSLDIAGGIVGVLLTAVLTIFVAPAIMIESPGPIFFSQTRIGKNGRRFKIYKFRSMYMDAEERKKELMEQNKMSGLMFKMDDDPRITKVGKFIRKTSIDEFPQFWNVLKGDMSLVGTRPPTEDEFKQYKARYKKRLSMKPGITGLWQVSGRSEITDFEDVVKLDVEYIENWSFGRDLKILLQTVMVVLKHDGAQ